MFSLRGTAARLRSARWFAASRASSVFSSQKPHNPRLQATCPSRSLRSRSAKRLNRHVMRRSKQPAPRRCQFLFGSVSSACGIGGVAAISAPAVAISNLGRDDAITAHSKNQATTKSRRANSSVKPISSGSANTTRQIAALALCCFASSCHRPAKSAPNPAFYASTQKSARHVWHSRPIGLHFQL